MTETNLEAWLRSQTWPDLKAKLREGNVVAYIHPYGFTVCRLRSHQPGWELRIHFWPSRANMVESMSASGTDRQLVHAHGWSLLSVVIVGEMDETTFEVKHLAASDLALYQVRSDYGTGISELSLLDESVGLSPLERVRRRPGDGVFPIAKATFHSSLPTDSQCVTLVATEISSAASHVVAPRQLGSTTVNARLPVEDLEEVIATFDAEYSALAGDSWAAFVFIVCAGDVLLVRTARRPDLWQPVGGRQDVSDASPEETVLREVREEIGLTLTRESMRPAGASQRDVGDGVVHFWLVNVEGRPEVTLQREELVELRWVPLTKAPSLAMYPAAAHALRQLGV